MLKKISYIALLVFLTNSLQAQFIAPKANPNNPLNIDTEVHRTDLITYAKKYISTIYHWGGIEPVKGFDCSGFVYYVFKNFKITVPRVSREYQYKGTSLKPADFKVGDVLVFYGYRDKKTISHLGIICEADGMNSKFIHSSSGKAHGVTISELGSKMYTRRFYKCVSMIKD
jgi:cell wall-associated NlpC family hydrolase